MDVKLIVRLVITYAVFAAMIFVPAGTINWVAGWVFLGLMIVYAAFSLTQLSKHNPDVIEERKGIIKEDQKTWDKVFTVVITVVYLGWIIFLPIDAVRLKLSLVPLWAQIIGGILMMAGFYLVHIVAMENAYLSRTVRIQDERGHQVIDTGPYAIVRHPMYVGVIVIFPGMALLLGSGWGALVGVILALAFPLRIIGEERMLREELAGYVEYMERVRHRLIPGVW